MLPTAENMRVVRDGNHRYLFVAEPPDKLWPLVREFWQENGFLLTVDMPDAGVMETDWAENRAKLPQDAIRNALGKLLDQVYSTGERDKFRRISSSALNIARAPTIVDPSVDAQ